MSGVAVLGNGTTAQLTLHAISHASPTAAPHAAADAYQIVMRSADVAVLAAAHAGVLWRLRERGLQVPALLCCCKVHHSCGLVSLAVPARHSHEPLT